MKHFPMKKLIARLKKKKEQLDAEFSKPAWNLHNIEHLSRDLHAAAMAANQQAKKTI